MTDYLPFLIFGLATGSVYGLSAMGLVLTYKTSGVFNLAHGAVGAAAAYTFYDLRQENGVSWPLAALIVVVVFGLVVGLVLERAAVLLAPVTTAYKIVGTIGLLVAIRALIGLRYGDGQLPFNTFLPQDTAFTIASVDTTVEQVIVLLLGMCAATGLAVFFRVTRLGTAMRGVVDDPMLLDLSGTEPARVRRSAWVIGTSFSAASGVLFASNQGLLDVNVLSLLVVQAFGAATLARFKSIPMAFVGGLIVGVVQKLVSKAVVPYESLQGLDLIVPFLFLFLGLLVIPRAGLSEVGRTVKSFTPQRLELPVLVRNGGYAAFAIMLVLLPFVVGSRLPAYNIALSQVVLFASLHLLVRTSGQISLMHFGFAAVGAAAFAHSLGSGVPYVIAVLLAGLACVPVALIISIPAIRLSGLFLALSTLGFGIVLAQFFYSKSYFFANGLATRRPPGADSDKGFYFVLLAVAALSVAVAVVIERARLGRLLRAMSDSPLALSTVGVSVNISRVLIFVISGFMAGISGALYAAQFGSVNQDAFNFVQSLLALTVLSIAGRNVITAAFLAPFLLYVLPIYISDVTLNRYLQLAFGLGAVATAAASQGGVRNAVARALARDGDRGPGPASDRGSRAAPVTASERRPARV